MAYKQPRVPEFNEREGTVRHLKALTAFLKDFCMAAWKADTQREKEIGSVSYPVTSVNGETGDVVLDAKDVGARADTWTPSAQDVGALPEDGTAKDSDKLGGKTWAERMLEVYPVGSIYMSANSASPASLFGGTWEQLKDRFLLGAGGSYAAGSTGGAATHKLTISEIPSHLHRYDGYPLTEDYDWAAPYPRVGYVYTETNPHPGNLYSSYTGGGAAHNNMPPYLVVNMWKRVN